MEAFVDAADVHPVCVFQSLFLSAVNMDVHETLWGPCHGAQPYPFFQHPPWGDQHPVLLSTKPLVLGGRGGFNSVFLTLHFSFASLHSRKLT